MNKRAPNKNRFSKHREANAPTTVLLVISMLLTTRMAEGQQKPEFTEQHPVRTQVRLSSAPIIAGQSRILRWPSGNSQLISIWSSRTLPPLDFPLQVKVEPDDGLQVTVPPGTPSGTYDLEVAGADSDDHTTVAHAQITVTAVTIPKSGSGKNPAILLNGFQLLCTNSDSTIAASGDTFGKLASLLASDDIPVAFFNNCSYGDISIEKLAAQLAAFIGNLTYTDGSAVTGQVDLVAHSMGGLIARAYLAGLQLDGSVSPPSDPRTRKLILIATPNFGSFEAPRIGIQAPEMVPGSTFLWNLATWNQFEDDLRGVDAIAVVGNAGNYYFGNNADDGVVALTSASLGFTRSDQRTRVVPYCHITPGVSTVFGTVGMICSGQQGIADIDSASHFTAQIVRSFLANTPAWTITGSSPGQNAILSRFGGVYFAVENAAGTQYFSDLTQVSLGNTNFQNGGASHAVYYDEFIQGTGTWQFVSASLGTVGCGSLTIPVGRYWVSRCKYGPILTSVSPLVTGFTAVLVQSGATITLNGLNLGQQCSKCQVLASPGALALTVSSWSDQAITVFLPVSLAGLIQLTVSTSNGSDTLSAMAIRPPPALGPMITSVANAFSGSPGIAPNTWVTIMGTNLAPDARSWQSSDFVNNRMPTVLDGVTVTLNGKNAYIYYISPGQLNVLTPPDLATGSIQIQINNNGSTGVFFNVQGQQYSLSFFTFDGHHVTATHANGSLLGPTTLYPGSSTPAAPQETVILYATGFGQASVPIISGASTQTGSLPTLPLVTIGGITATVQFAGLVSPGTYQFNVVVPSTILTGDQSLTATYNGLTTQAGVYLAVDAGATAPAFVLYGVDAGSSSSSILYQIDLTTGQSHRIGTLPFYSVTDIAFTPDEQLYGLGQQAGVLGLGSTTNLLHIDPLEGFTSVVGNWDLGSAVSLVSDTDGTLYAATRDSTFLKIDRNTGQPTVIGGFGPGYASSGDLAFDAAGRLYGSILGSTSNSNNLLVIVDKRTGNSAVIGNIGFKQVYGLAFLPDGRLIGVANGEGPIATLIQIDPGTGRGTAIAPVTRANGIYGLAGGMRTWPATLTVLRKLTATSVDQSGCIVPSLSSTFSPKASQALIWFDVANAKQGDTASAIWQRPDGSTQLTYTWNPISDDGYWCLWDALNISGSGPAGIPGLWKVEINWNGSPLFASTFTITSQ